MTNTTPHHKLAEAARKLAEAFEAFDREAEAYVETTDDAALGEGYPFARDLSELAHEVEAYARRLARAAEVAS